jgi:precorrin-4 C11-methyltransferase
MSELYYTATPGTVYFIGAGPGAPDLITVRGRDLIAQADLILYADSLVEESVAGFARKDQVRIETSSQLHLEQILDLIVETAQTGGIVARIHSGDPALYGAVHEQMAYLEDHDIPYEVVPGVTAAFAAAAQLKTELTVPDVVQTIILTRTAGRTTMPEGEDLKTLAAPGASLAIYLSVSRIRQVVDDLLASGGYGPETPVAVHHKVTWPDQSHVTGALADIVEKVKAAGYTKHALILVSPALDPRLKGKQRRTSSHLYDKTYTHRFRRAENSQRGKERQEAAVAANSVVLGEKHLGHQAGRQGCAVIALTRRGSQLAYDLGSALQAEIAIPAKFATPSGNEQLAMNNDQLTIDNSSNPPTFHSSNLPLFQPSTYPDSALAEIRRRWGKHSQLVLIMPTGVVVRAIAPLLGHKSSDPAVVCLDEAGQSIIPLLGGHQAGANDLARRIAAMTGGRTAITTASDLQGKPALDQMGDGWRIDPGSALTYASGCLVNAEPVGVYLDPALTMLRPAVETWLGQADNLTPVGQLDDLDLDAYVAGLIISHQALSDHHRHLLRKSVLYRPPVLVAGLGCKRGTARAELHAALISTLTTARLAPDSLAALATIDLKADEAGLHELAAELGLSLQIVGRERLAHLEEAGLSPSAAQDKFGLPGVAEPSALLVAGSNAQLLVPKRSFERCTVAVALITEAENHVISH